MSDFRADLRAALAAEVGCRFEDIIDVKVIWDDGDRYDPTYPGDNAPPTLETRVTFHTTAHGRLTTTATVGAQWTFTALLRAVLAIGDTEHVDSISGRSRVSPFRPSAVVPE